MRWLPYDATQAANRLRQKPLPGARTVGKDIDGAVAAALEWWDMGSPFEECVKLTTMVETRGYTVQ
jgi:hypothetical protein